MKFRTQQRIFAEEGVDLSRVVIGHSRRHDRPSTTSRNSLPMAPIIGMDRFGVDLHCSFEDRVNTVARMCARGHAGTLVLLPRR